MTSCLSPISTVLEDFKQGRMIILIDDEDRENEGDLVIPASITTPEHINFMATHGRGLICLAMSPADIDRLELPLMTDKNDCRLGTAFTVSIDAVEGATTGISAYDRALTAQLAANPDSRRSDFAVPGHMFPLRAKENGVFDRIGHTEASVDLTRLSGLGTSAVICEIMHDNGKMARLPDLIEYAKKHDLHIASINDTVDYLKQQRDAA